MTKRILIAEDDRTTRHLLSRTLKNAGFSVATAKDGVEGLQKLKAEPFDLVLLDIWMPRMNGLELLAQMRLQGAPAKAIVMTSDTTPETLLQAVREQAYRYLSKPVEPKELVAMVHSALEAAPADPIEVLSARPEWVELLVPCTVDAAERIQGFMACLDAGLSEEIRDSVGRVFHEMLLNAVEWGGRLDPNRKVRVSCLRARRMVMYRIADPGPGFKIEDLAHAAAGQPADRPVDHLEVRAAKGLRPGGFGIVMARAMVDELLYNEARNEVAFVKYL